MNMFWNLFWKAWFIFVLIGEILPDHNYKETLQFILKFKVNLFDCLYTQVLYPIAIIGVFGFAYHKKLINKRFWQIFFPSFVTMSFIYNLTMFYLHRNVFNFNDFKGLEDGSIFLFISIGFAIASLFNISLYLPLGFYAFKRNKFWQDTEIKNYSLWKILFFISFMNFFSELFILPAFKYPFFLNEKIDLFVSVISLIGIYGLAWEKKLLSKLFWQVFTVFSVIWTLSLFVLPHSEVLLTIIHNNISIAGVLSVLIAYLPITLGLLAYSFTSDKIWESSSLKSQ